MHSSGGGSSGVFLKPSTLSVREVEIPWGWEQSPSCAWGTVLAALMLESTFSWFRIFQAAYTRGELGPEIGTFKSHGTETHSL